MAKLISAIEFGAGYKGYTLKNVATLMGVQEPTYYARKNDPMTFRLLELVRLSKKLNLTITIKNGKINAVADAMFEEE